MRPRASLYVRLSREAGDTNTSLASMGADLRQLCADRGFDEVALHIDNGVSGAVRNRPEFLAWLADGREGRADVLATPHADRLSREGANVAALLLDAVEGKDSTTGKVKHRPVRLLDLHGLDSDDGDGFRYRFVIGAEVARGERERIKARTKRAKRALADQRRWAGGPPPYGYRTAPHPSGTGRALEVDPIEAAHVRRAAEHVLGGGSLYSAMKLLEREGSTPRRAKAWALKSLSIVLMGDPALGRMRHGGRLVLDAEGRPETVWTPILTVGEVERLRALLAPRPQGQRRRRATRLLSGLLICGSCGGRLRVNSSQNSGRLNLRYSCRGDMDGRGCTAPVSIAAERVDEHMAEQYLALMGDRDVYTRQETEPEDQRLAEVERAIRDVLASLDVADDDEAAALYGRHRALKRERDELRQRAGRRVVQLVSTGQTFREAWEDAEGDIAARRALMAVAFPRITVGPGVRGRTGIDASRLFFFATPTFDAGVGRDAAWEPGMPTADASDAVDDDVVEFRAAEAGLSVADYLESLSAR
jgi:DNA invertase Pin-like site-specific DNA recombinase